MFAINNEATTSLQNGEKAVSEEFKSERRSSAKKMDKEMDDSSEEIQFQGLTFITDNNVEIPYKIKSNDKSQAYTDCKDVLSFLNYLKTLEVLSQRNDSGLIVVVDDQFVTLQSLKLKFEEIGITDRLLVFSNGQEVVDYFDTLLKDTINQRTDSEVPL